MKVIVSEAGYGGSEFPGGAEVRIETDKGALLASISVWDDVNNHDVSEATVDIVTMAGPVEVRHALRTTVPPR